MRAPEFADHGFRQHEQVAKQVVEALGNIARQFEMLTLIVPHRDLMGLIEQDIGRHQDGVVEQSGRHAVRLLLGCLVLVLGHAVEPTDRRHAVQNPGQLGMGRNMRLHEDRRHVGIDTTRNVQRGNFTRLGGQLLRVLQYGDSVHVHDAEEALVVMLFLDPLAECAEIIADSKVARRLNAGQDPPLA